MKLYEVLRILHYSDDRHHVILGFADLDWYSRELDSEAIVFYADAEVEQLWADEEDGKLTYYICIQNEPVKYNDMDAIKYEKQHLFS